MNKLGDVGQISSLFLLIVSVLHIALMGIDLLHYSYYSENSRPARPPSAALTAEAISQTASHHVARPTNANYGFPTGTPNATPRETSSGSPRFQSPLVIPGSLLFVVVNVSESFTSSSSEFSPGKFVSVFSAGEQGWIPMTSLHL